MNEGDDSEHDSPQERELHKEGWLPDPTCPHLGGKHPQRQRPGGPDWADSELHICEEPRMWVSLQEGQGRRGCQAGGKVAQSLETASLALDARLNSLTGSGQATVCEASQVPSSKLGGD